MFGGLFGGRRSTVGARLWSSNIRFGMLSDANRGLFIVYDIEGFDRFRSPGAGRSLTVKYSHLFDLLN